MGLQGLHRNGEQVLRSARLHAAAAAGGFNLGVGLPDHFVETRLDSSGFIVSLESQQALMVAVQGPDIVRVLRAAW